MYYVITIAIYSDHILANGYTCN